MRALTLTLAHTPLFNIVASAAALANVNADMRPLLQRGVPVLLASSPHTLSINLSEIVLLPFKLFEYAVSYINALGCFCSSTLFLIVALLPFLTSLVSLCAFAMHSFYPYEYELCSKLLKKHFMSIVSCCVIFCSFALGSWFALRAIAVCRLHVENIPWLLSEWDKRSWLSSEMADVCALLSIVCSACLFWFFVFAIFTLVCRVTTKWLLSHRVTFLGEPVYYRWYSNLGLALMVAQFPWFVFKRVFTRVWWARILFYFVMFLGFGFWATVHHVCFLKNHTPAPSITIHEYLTSPHISMLLHKFWFVISSPTFLCWVIVVLLFFINRVRHRKPLK